MSLFTPPQPRDEMSSGAASWPLALPQPGKMLLNPVLIPGSILNLASEGQTCTKAHQSQGLVSAMVLVMHDHRSSPA